MIFSLEITRFPVTTITALSGNTDWPAGTGTTTVFFCLVWPRPRHDRQGWVMTVPLPPHWRQVERITNGPVFTVSCKGDDTRVQKCNAKTPWRNRGWRGPHHAGAAAGGAALHLAARLVTFTVAVLAGCVDVNRDFLVDALCCLSERQLHSVLYSKREQMAGF